MAGITTVNAVDATGATIHILAGSDGTNVAPGHTLIDVNGSPTGTSSNPLLVSRPDVRATGQTIAANTANAAYTLSLNNGEGVVGFTVSGLTAAAATLTVEASNDGGTTWSAINTTAPGTGVLSTTITADGQFRVNAGGHTHVRLRVSTTGSGTITVASNASSVAPLHALSAPVPLSSVSAMTTASVTTSSAQVLAARTARRRLSFQNTGAGSITLLFGTGTAVVGAGIVLTSGGAAGSQGGSWEEPAHECWAGAVQAIGAAASTLTIIEG